MKPIATFSVSPSVPEALSPLSEIAYNYWWCWHKPAIDLFSAIDRDRWESVGRNPVAMLASLSAQELAELTTNTTFMARLSSVYETFTLYMSDKGWYGSTKHPSASYVAYFCAEFGIHESFSSYSGGLGVLAGDHLKSASDLGIPLVGVGLLYQEGYFSQYLTQDGWQKEQYHEVDFHTHALTRVRTADGKPLLVSVDLPSGTCNVQIWRLNVGRVPLYLLDTNVDQPADASFRNITDRLYGGDVHTRIMQEIVLGVGGVRALQALGIEPSVVHINEGHAAFSMLERTRNAMATYAMNFAEAFRLTAASSVFTTHTPVPAGNEVFDRDTLKSYFGHYAAQMGLSWDEFLELGTARDRSKERGFSMTVLGLRGSVHRNGVSQLHGEVAREMWHDVWHGFDQAEVPIKGITNGVHTATWVGGEMASLYDQYLGPKWRSEPQNESSWSAVAQIPNDKLWEVRSLRRKRLVEGARKHILEKHSASLSSEQAAQLNDCLDPNILTIGFARRFATYKRADLLMTDMDRLSRLVLDAKNPIQIILAGKAHPNDGLGKELIQSVHQKIKEYGLQHRIVFLEDYNMDVARLMVRGCDVWLNTPRRPHEASGTSGMKAALNGVLHCSIMDGWWAEAYNGSNGFTIGRGEEFSEEEQDVVDSATLYDVIEHHMIPMFYNRDEAGLPFRWLEMMKECISSLSWRFSALRMVFDYTTLTYEPTMQRYRRFIDNNAELPRSAESFFTQARKSWSNVAIQHVNVTGGNDAQLGSLIRVTAEINLHELHTSQVVVQCAYGRVDASGNLRDTNVMELRPTSETRGVASFEGTYVCSIAGKQGCTVRVLPTHPSLTNFTDAHLVTYA